MPNDARGNFTEKTTAVLLQYFQENLPALKGQSREKRVVRLRPEWNMWEETAVLPFISMAILPALRGQSRQK